MNSKCDAFIADLVGQDVVQNVGVRFTFSISTGWFATSRKPHIMLKLLTIAKKHKMLDEIYALSTPKSSLLHYNEVAIWEEHKDEEDEYYLISFKDWLTSQGIMF